MRQETDVSPNYLGTESLDHFGYIKLQNVFTQRPLEDISCMNNLDRYGNKNRRAIEVVIEKLELPKSTIPLIMDLPPRPVNDTNLEDMGSSVAELAGVAASIKLTTGSPVEFMGVTNLGRFAQRWFDIVTLPQPDMSTSNRWMQSARGEKGVEKQDKKASLVYCSGDDLMKRYNAEIIENDVSEFKAGNLSIIIHKQGIYTMAKDKFPSRSDIHVFRGFIQAFGPSALIRRGKTPLILLQDSPLMPYSTLNGYYAAEKMISLDRIRSYI